MNDEEVYEIWSLVSSPGEGESHRTEALPRSFSKIWTMYMGEDTSVSGSSRRVSKYIAEIEEFFDTILVVVWRWN